MAVVLLSSQDYYTPLSRVWTVNGDQAIGSGSGRGGTNSIRQPTNSAGAGQTLTSVYSLGGNQSEVFAGFWCDVDSDGTVTHPRLISFFQSATFMVRLSRVVSTGKMEIRWDSGSGAATVDYVMVPGDYIELRAKFGASGALEVKVNGASVYTNSGITVGDSGSTANNLVVLGADSGNSGRIDLDDIYVINTTSPNTTFLGTQFVNAYFPDADGFYSGWTPSTGGTGYNLINEHDPDSDTSYIRSTAANTISSFSMDPVPTDAVIRALVIRYFIGVESGSPTYQPLIRISSTDYLGSTVTPAGGGYFYSSSIIYNTSPATSAAWTATEVNAMQVGIKQIAAGTMRLSQMVMEVIYSTTTSAAAALSGQGTLTADTDTVAYAAAALSGQGTLTAATQNTVYGAAALHGSGTLTADAAAIQYLASTLHGSGTLTAEATHVIPPVPTDVVIPLFKTLDYTLTYDTVADETTITFVNEETTPVDGQRVMAYWPEMLIEPAAHTHHYLLKDEWSAEPPITWTLPSVAMTDTLRVYLQQIPPLLNIPLYVVYDGADSPSTHNAKVRRMGLNRDDGTFVEWETAAIGGFLGESGTSEIVHAIAYHPSDRDLCYIATQDGTTSRVYKCDGASLSVVHSVVSGGHPGQIVVDTDGRVAWCVAGFGAFPPADGVYASDTNGENFTGQGAGFEGNWVGGSGAGIQSLVWVDGEIATVHNRTEGVPSNPGTKTIVVTLGPTWTSGGLVGSCRDQFSNDLGERGSIGYASDIGQLCWSYWHFAQFLGTPSYTSGTISGGTNLTFDTTDLASGVWPNGDGLAFQPDTGDWYLGNFGGSAWTQGGTSLGNELRRGFNLLGDPERQWAAHAPYLSNVVEISIDAGVSWFTIPDMPFVRLVAWQGGSN